jgi:large subunit ribosomal protein L35
MPKLKTHKGAKKRMKVTGTGKVARSKANRRHILTSKDSNRKRNLGRKALVSKADIGAVRKMLPYAF